MCCATKLVSLGALARLYWGYWEHWDGLSHVTGATGMGHTSGMSHGSCCAILLVLLGALGDGGKVALGLLLLLGALGGGVLCHSCYRQDWDEV